MILGLAGSKRSGKNTVGNFLQEKYRDKYQVTQWSFAHDLKFSFARIFFPDISRQAAEEWCNALKASGEISVHGFFLSGSVTGREALQHYGTEAHRDVFGEDFWINNLFNRIFNNSLEIECSHDETLDIITDVRYDNEAYAIKEAGGVIWQVIRDFDMGEPEHASEVPIKQDYVDNWIYNKSDLKSLRSVVIHSFEQELTRWPLSVST